MKGIYCNRELLKGFLSKVNIKTSLPCLLNNYLLVLQVDFKIVEVLSMLYFYNIDSTSFKL